MRVGNNIALNVSKWFPGVGDSHCQVEGGIGTLSSWLDKIGHSGSQRSAEFLSPLEPWAEL